MPELITTFLSPLKKAKPSIKLEKRFGFDDGTNKFIPGIVYRVEKVDYENALAVCHGTVIVSLDLLDANSKSIDLILEPSPVVYKQMDRFLNTSSETPYYFIYRNINKAKAKQVLAKKVKEQIKGTNLTEEDKNKAVEAFFKGKVKVHVKKGDILGPVLNKTMEFQVRSLPSTVILPKKYEAKLSGNKHHLAWKAWPIDPFTFFRQVSRKGGLMKGTTFEESFLGFAFSHARKQYFCIRSHENRPYLGKVKMSIEIQGSSSEQPFDLKAEDNGYFHYVGVHGTAYKVTVKLQEAKHFILKYPGKVVKKDNKITFDFKGEPFQAIYQSIPLNDIVSVEENNVSQHNQLTYYWDKTKYLNGILNQLRHVSSHQNNTSFIHIASNCIDPSFQNIQQQLNAVSPNVPIHVMLSKTKVKMDTEAHNNSNWHHGALTLAGTNRHLLLDGRVRTILKQRFPNVMKRWLSQHNQKFVICHDKTETKAFLSNMEFHNEDQGDFNLAIAPTYHYFGLSIEGPGVKQINDVFRERWNEGTQPHPAKSINSSTQKPGSLVVKVLRTYGNYTERSSNGSLMHQYSFASIGKIQVLEAIQKMISLARQYIYIETDVITCMTLANELQKKARTNLPIYLVLSDLDYHDTPQMKYRVNLALHTICSATSHRVLVRRIPTNNGQQNKVTSNIVMVDDSLTLTATGSLMRRDLTNDSQLGLLFTDTEFFNNKPLENLKFRIRLVNRFRDPNKPLNVDDPYVLYRYREPIALLNSAFNSTYLTPITVPTTVSSNMISRQWCINPEFIWREIDPDGKWAVLHRSLANMIEDAYNVMRRISDLDIATRRDRTPLNYHGNIRNFYLNATQLSRHHSGYADDVTRRPFSGISKSDLKHVLLCHDAFERYRRSKALSRSINPESIMSNWITEGKIIWNLWRKADAIRRRTTVGKDRDWHRDNGIADLYRASGNHTNFGSETWRMVYQRVYTLWRCFGSDRFNHRTGSDHFPVRRRDYNLQNQAFRTELNVLLAHNELPHFNLGANANAISNNIVQILSRPITIGLRVSGTPSRVSGTPSRYRITFSITRHLSAHQLELTQIDSNSTFQGSDIRENSGRWRITIHSTVNYNPAANQLTVLANLTNSQRNALQNPSYGNAVLGFYGTTGRFTHFQATNASNVMVPHYDCTIVEPIFLKLQTALFLEHQRWAVGVSQGIESRCLVPWCHAYGRFNANPNFRILTRQAHNMMAGDVSKARWHLFEGILHANLGRHFVNSTAELYSNMLRYAVSEQFFYMAFHPEAPYILNMRRRP